jgi:hypothetical protein
MSVQNYFETNVGTQNIDVSASTRKFQTSLVIKQDRNKSGILSFLQEVEQSNPAISTQTAALTMTPTTQGNY